MKNFVYLSVIIVFCSCSNKKKESNQTIVQTPSGLEGLQKNVSSPVVQSAKTNLIYNPAHGKPGHTCALAVGAPLQQSAATQPQKNITNASSVTTPISVNTSGKKLNPKHGEPGHRCDIAVGAPLDSKPAAIAKTASTPSAISQAASVKVAKGMNPPHGQPNHRCDIAVGAPLNSKIVQLPKNVKTPDVQPIESKIMEAGQSEAKLNPKHGDPGHRCDIAVGAPLT
ncbi:hypothetical protein EV200_103501 [Pedobacter psychrotolerans]|uniref:Uncharacterized protein n=1 Tax=Pedobacter psychrotolerans TaxID=1843235 RepID=A0A4R2HGC1_9SPHI|nr:hypothetical protein [Pedobacter psychrotolerans]TCO27167.1 hypothetical protein EV200_103501 [Pedobacter psychrotolerans]GGE59418.1 hypothetical protein GCM10011413_27370 [Pedobacter psychrotolerans]